MSQRAAMVRRKARQIGGWLGPYVPQAYAVVTFVAGAILLFSGATPARAGRMGWINDVLPLPIVEASAYFASIAGVGLILLARGLQHRLNTAYHLTVWLLLGGILFSLTSALDVEQAVALSIMLAMLFPSKQFFYRKSSMLEERFTAGWIAAIGLVLAGAAATAIDRYGAAGLGTHVFWRFNDTAQGPRAQRALLVAAITLAAYGLARLLRPARMRVSPADDTVLAAAAAIAAASPRAGAQLAFLGDKAFMFDATGTAFIMYGVSGRSWVALGDPVGPVRESVHLIERFITECDRSGGWPVFYRVTPALLHLYLDYALAVVKLGEIARVPLPEFSLDGPKRRNLRRVWRKAVDDGCTFEMIAPDAYDALMPRLRVISDTWLDTKGVREKSFSLGAFAPEFVRRSALGVVRQHGEIVAFVTLWRSGQRGEVEVDLMRFVDGALPGIMRYALIEAMFWASKEGYAWFNLGPAPLSGIRASAVSPIWNQVSLAVRGVGERYYNFQGLRDFKEWFYPEWESTYLVSPGGTKRPIILANIASLISGGFGGLFKR